MYNYSNNFKNKSEVILNEFIHNHTGHVKHVQENSSNWAHYKHILEILETPFEEDTFLDAFKNLAKHSASFQIPFVVLINEIHNLKNILMNEMIDEENCATIVEILSLFNKVNNVVAKIFLLEYIERMFSANNLRINSLADLIDKNIISHYESHLVWLNTLAKCIKQRTTDSFPELNSSMCEFGLWLHNDAKSIIRNNSKYSALTLLHEDLHLFGKKIFNVIGKGEHNIIMTYLEKCEFLSLSIGTELALVNNIIMNTKVTKDALTGTLNRNSLNSIFESQYELSLATNNHFVLAMCDLDNFKHVNDTYGHIAGDKMLELFSNIVKANMRNSDIIIRYGGEEFIILLPALTKEFGRKVLDTIRVEFEKAMINYNGKDIKTTVSIGMMDINPKEYFKKSFINEYIEIVDQKLYKAKKNGKNRVEVY